VISIRIAATYRPMTSARPQGHLLVAPAVALAPVALPVSQDTCVLTAAQQVEARGSVAFGSARGTGFGSRVVRPATGASKVDGSFGPRDRRNADMGVEVDSKPGSRSWSPPV
jgi:hypothetical protein